MTDRCNLRCVYCLPERYNNFTASSKMLKDDEIVRLVGLFASLGLRKIRLTGGEPLLRPKITTLIARIKADYSRPHARRQIIHIWWGGLQRNGDLMLLLAHLLTRNPYWRRAHIRILSITPPDEHVREAHRALKQLIADTRIPAAATVIKRPEGRSIADIIRERSSSANLVFLGLNVPGEGEAHAYAERLQSLAEGLRTVVFVKNSSLFEGELV